jgi:serine protease Do
MLLFSLCVSRGWSREPNAFAEAIAYAQKRCVKIYGTGIGREHGYATGLLVSGDGLVLTATGPYLAGSNIRVILPDGVLHRATLLRREDRLLCGLLKIEAATPDFFELSAQSKAQAGDWVVAIGNTFKIAEGREFLSVHLGIVSLRTRLDAKYKAQNLDLASEVLVLDAITSNPGIGGGALVNLENKLVGMVGRVVESEDTQTRLNYALPIETLREFVHPKPDSGNGAATAASTSTDTPAVVKRADLGIRVFKLSGLGAPAYIERVVPSSSAASAGLKKDDLVLKVGDRVVQNCREYLLAEESLAPGQSVPLTLKRKQEILLVSVVAGVRDVKP